MNLHLVSIITNPGVDHLSNSGAITSDSRLGLDDSESHELVFGVNQHFPKGEVGGL